MRSSRGRRACSLVTYPSWKGSTTGRDKKSVARILPRRHERAVAMKEPLPPLENLRPENRPRYSRCPVLAPYRAHGSTRCIPIGRPAETAPPDHAAMSCARSRCPFFHRQSLVPFWLSRQVELFIFSRGGTTAFPFSLSFAVRAADRPGPRHLKRISFELQWVSVYTLAARRPGSQGPSPPVT